MTVSVIMCALNQGDWVRKTVPQLEHAFAGMAHETIVVDDQSTDGCCHDLPREVLILRTRKRLGVSGSRRFAVEHATGKVLLFSDPHCDYPPGSLRDLCQKASNLRAICQPRTTSPPEQMKPRFGGSLVTSERGLRVKRERNRPAFYPALVGTIYAIRRDLYDFLGGWPLLPGVWGYSEQALTLMSWFAGVPIYVDTRHCCVHHNYHPRDDKGGQHFAYPVSLRDQASNGHWIHAAFFPRSYPLYWREVLYAQFGRSRRYDDVLKTDEFAKFSAFVEKRRARTEEQFFCTYLKSHPPQSDQTLSRQQEKKAGAREYKSVRRRLEYAVHWAVRQFRGTTEDGDPKKIPGCLRDQRVLDLGSRDGYSTHVFKKWGMRPLGVELVPAAAQHAQSQGRCVVTCDMRALPESNNSWDFVSAIHSLEHVPDPETARDEMVRVLRPGGWLFVVVPKEDEPSTDHVHNTSWGSMDAFVDFICTHPKLIRKSARTKEGQLHRGLRELRVLIQKSK